MADAVEASLQVDLDDTVEIFFLHPQQQTVFGDAGIVDQHIDAAHFLHDIVHHLLHGRIVCHIAAICHRLHALFLTQGDDLTTI